MMERLFAAVRSAVYATGFIALWWWLALQVRTFDARIGIALPSWTSSLGAVMIGVGFILVVACIAAFSVQGRGTPALFDAPRVFVAKGPYARVRNPMYIGAFTMLVGFGLFERSAAIVILSLVWLMLFHVFVRFVEEPLLKEKFGPAYSRYLADVPRWIPMW